ncbi:MAG: hypothetical protein J0M15_06940 [Deltaproteobacteria bacterium]|nr:hypothetical protein [Deltaproteobacteria bacterium]
MKTLIFLVSSLSLVSCDFIKTTGVTESTVSSTSTQDGSNPTSTPDFTITQDPNVPPPHQGDNGTLPVVPPETPPDLSIEEGFSINNDEPATSSPLVQLQLRTLSPYSVKIGSAVDCSDGIWETYAPVKSFQLSSLAALASVTVRFQDWEGGLSPCYRKSIIFDNQGPDILFQKYPQATLEEGTKVDISVNVTDKISKVISVKCKLNEIQKECFAGLSGITIPSLPQGNYLFSVEAEDELHNLSRASVSWKVNSLTRLLTQEVDVNDYKKVDILFVIDNSGSMQYEQQSMAQRTSQFLSILTGLNYQLAVTTTDPRDINLGDGRLIPIKNGNGRYIIDSSQEVATAQTQLSQTLQRPETGSGSEQGIRAVYRSVERYNNNESNMRSFMRSDSQLAVVLISDEDESDNTTKNDPQALLNLIHSSWSGQKRFSFHSIITRPGDTACRSTYGATYGERYSILSNLTGGIIGNVCEMDYANQVRGVAEGIRNLLKTLTLQCAPLEGYPITISKNGVVINPAFIVEGVNLKFNAELEPGKYSVQYSCLK